MSNTAGTTEIDEIEETASEDGALTRFVGGLVWWLWRSWRRRDP